MDLTPTEDRVIAEREGPWYVAQNESGILIPWNDAAVDRKAVEVSRVLATGPEVRDVEVGDRVLHDRYAGTEIYVDDGTGMRHRELVVLDMSELVAVVLDPRPSGLPT